jgi:hypothetical protein
MEGGSNLLNGGESGEAALKEKQPTTKWGTVSEIFSAEYLLRNDRAPVHWRPTQAPAWHGLWGTPQRFVF